MFRRKKSPFWPTTPRVQLDVKHIAGSRALYLGPEIQRIALAVTTTDDQIVEFELSLPDAAKLLAQVGASYQACLPTTRRTPFN